MLLDHGVLPPQLHRGAVFKLGCGGQPRRHLRADAGGAENPAGEVPLWRVRPCEGHPGGLPGADLPAGPVRRPHEREHRAAQPAEPEAAGPSEKQGENPLAHGAYPGQHPGEQPRPFHLPPRAPVRPGGAVHPDDRGRHSGKRPADSPPDRGAVPQVRAEAGVLFRLYACGQRQEPARFGHAPASAAGAPAVSGGLAAAVLRLFRRGDFRRGRPQLRPPAGPQVRLGRAPHGALPRGGEQSPL